MLERFRINRHTIADIELINKRWIGHRNIDPPRNIDYVYTDNKNREALNDFAFEVMVRQSGINAAEKDISKIKFLTIIINVSLHDIEEARNKKTSEYLKAYIRNMLEPSLKRMSGYLNVVIGGKAILNSNLCTSKGLANGTGCRVVKVELTPDAVIRQRKIHGTNLYVPCVYAHEVEALICEHVLPRYNKKTIRKRLTSGTI